MRSLIQLFSDLRAAGVNLSLDGERLICNAPKGAVTPEIRKDLTDRKQEIIAFLRESSAYPSSTHLSDALFDLPLSRSQRRLWFLARLDPQNCAYNITIALRLTGALNEIALGRALHQLVQRHESLRTAFYETNGHPRARIVDGAAWEMASVDLSFLAPDDAKQEADRISRDEARKPFSVECAPLFRATLFRFLNESQRLLLVVHHIIADGWSLGILASELGALYNAFCAEEQPALSETSFQYRDYVRWEQDAGEKAAAKQMPFWLARLRGKLPVLELAGDRPRPAIQSSNGRRVSIDIEPPLALQLRELCRTTGTTQFMILLTAFKAVLFRYTGLQDILIGSATSNRHRQEVAPLVGFFVNNLVLRTDLSGNPSFSDLLTRVKETALSAYAHQDVPFDMLVEKLQPARALSQSPLVQVMFNFQNLPMQEIAMAGLKVEPEDFDSDIARMDLAIEVWPHGDRYLCYFEFNTDIFDEPTIRSLQSDYLDFLRQAVADPSIPIEDIAISSFAVQRRLLAKHNAACESAEHPLSRSQRRLWFLDQLDPGSAVYNISVAFRLDGQLNRNAFEGSLREIIARHESLRTRFLQRDGFPYALVEDAPDWRMHYADISSLPEDARQTEIARFAQEEFRKSFILDRGQLFRASLLKTATDAHVVLVVMHHIISDGWSLGIITKELGPIYESLVQGGELPLPPLQFQFRDFVAWEQRQLELSSAADMRYWKQQLAGELPPLELPADHARPALQTFRGNRLTTEISADLAGRLQKVSREQNATLFMILLASFDVFLRQYSRQEDILVGTPSAGRLKSDFEGVIGFFVNNLVLRTDLRGNPGFTDLIQRVQKTALEAFEHQTIPFDQLVEVLQPERSLDRSPIFQVLFTLQNAPLPELRMGGLRMTPCDFQGFRARYDLAVDIYPFEGNYRCEFEYNTDIFEEATVRQMQQHYIQLLESVAANPARPVSTLSVLNETERNHIVEGWNQTGMPIGPHATVPAWFQAQAVQSPGATAISMGEKNLSYAELDAESTRLAAVLRSLGVKCGTIVAIYLQRSPEMVTGLLGILKAGGAYLPLDPALPAQRIEFLLADAAVPLILTQTGLQSDLAEFRIPLLMIDDIATGLEEPIGDEPTAEDLAYLIYTSGSTGNPKGTEITHGSLVNLLASMLREPGLSARDTLVAVTTLSFDIAGLEIFGPLVCGAKLVLASRDQVLDPELLASLLEDSQATVMQATPSTWRMLVEAGWMGRANLRMWCGGEGLPPDLAESLLSRGRELWNLYGPTETTIWSAAHRVKNGENPVLIGKPIANTRMYILDADGQPVPIGVPGELYIGGDGVARGYWNRPELTEARFVTDPFDPQTGRGMYRTGDLARYRRDGQIQLIGRTDHQIKLRGHRIELGEIEVALERHPEVLQAVVGLQGEAPSQYLIAYVRKSDGGAETEHLRSWLQARLPEYMVPSIFISLAEIPLTPNGKVDRKRLPRPTESTRERKGPAVNPRNQLEERIADIWSEILGIERVGVRDNFFDLGGHSLLLIRIHSKLRQELNIEVAVIDLFRYPTIESMASWLDRRSQELALTGVSS
jgi:amino acid adenylation domain-containing protein